MLQRCVAHVSFSAVRSVCTVLQCWWWMFRTHTVCPRSSWRPHLWPDSLFSIDLACCWPLSGPLKSDKQRLQHIFGLKCTFLTQLLWYYVHICHSTQLYCVLFKYSAVKFLSSLWRFKRTKFVLRDVNRLKKLLINLVFF